MRVSEWIQGPDYQRTATRIVNEYGMAGVGSEWNPVITNAFHEVDPAGSDVDPALVAQTITESADAWVDATPIEAAADWRLQPLWATVMWEDSPFFPPLARYRAWRTFLPIDFSAWELNLLGQPPDMPANAIGWEWEGGVARSTVVSARMELRLKSYFAVDYGGIPEDAQPMLDGDSTVHWIIGDAGEWGIVDRDAGDSVELMLWGADTDAVGLEMATLGQTALGTTFDLSLDLPIFNAYDGRVWVLPTITIHSIPSYLTESAGGVPTSRSASWGYRHREFPQVVYTLHPPRHRWILAGDYDFLRVFPRDDHLGTASAARVWPPPRSEQGSNRRGPASYL